MSEHYDAVVLGLGGMGSAALAHLAARGARVLGLEQFSPAHALGSSHGGSRLIRRAYFEDPAYVPLVLRSEELWLALERQTGRRLFLRTGLLCAGRPEADVVAGSLLALRQHGITHEVLDATEVRARFPAMRPRPDEIGVFEPEAGVLFPEECILAHLQAAVQAGAEARFGVRVTGWEARHDGVRVETEGGAVEAERLVICTGPWLSGVAADLGLPLQVERQVMQWWMPTQPELFASERFPVWIVEREGPPLYGFPELPGQGLKAAFHHGGSITSAESVERGVTPGEVEAVEGALAGWMPDALGAHLRSEVCMYTNTPDGNFVIGLHPAHPNVVIAGGFSGHGFKFCPVVGEILADLALDGGTDQPIALFSPSRFDESRQAT